MLTDESVMWFGEHQGKKMADVPASYLLYLYDNKKCFGDLRTYIVKNLEDLRIEVKNESKGIK